LNYTRSGAWRCPHYSHWHETPCSANECHWMPHSAI